MQDLTARWSGFVHAPGTMMIHLALDGLPDWTASDELKSFAYVHIAPSLDQMARTYQQAVAGLLPDEPVLVVGQPTVVDPSRAPEGKHVLWVQVRMVPGEIRGDAAGKITETDWAQVKEIYAERALDIIDDELVIAYNVNLPSWDPTVGPSAVNPTIQGIYQSVFDQYINQEPDLSFTGGPADRMGLDRRQHQDPHGRARGRDLAQWRPLHRRGRGLVAGTRRPIRDRQPDPVRLVEGRQLHRSTATSSPPTCCSSSRRSSSGWAS
jgi:hypothetical protein